jgi:parallel beta-helix repeat protein
MVHLERPWLIILLAATFLAAFQGTAAAQSPTEIKKCRSISKPGSYLVTRNLPSRSGLKGNDCLTVRGDFVTIDLGGFVLTGNRKGNAITDKGKTRHSITVRNGTITNFKIGVDLDKTTEAVIRDLQVVDNDGDGIRAGKGCNISDNVASRNGGNGIYADDGNCIVEDNLANSNDEDGLQLNEPGHTVSGNTANENDKDGIQVDCPSNLNENTARDNDGDNLNEGGAGCVKSKNLAP